jgi:ADP-heptose:LPS heptosyltransferase
MYLTKKMYWPILFLIDILGSILFFWKKFKKRPIDKGKIRKVLFIRLEHIGDMIMSTPVFENFNRSNPHCEVHVLCKTITKPIIENNPYVDRIITFDPDWMMKRHEDRKKSMPDLIAGLKKEGYDIIFEMHGDPRNNFLAYKIGLSGAYTVGYGCRGMGFLLNEVEEYDPKIHNIEQNLDLIKDYAKIRTKKMAIYTDKKAKDDASRIMKKYGLKRKGFMIINPRSGRQEKDLTHEEVDRFIKRGGTRKILITGAETDRIYNDQFISRSDAKNIINISGETGLLTLTELVRNARIVIAPDTGIIHMAKTVGTRFEAVYKTTDKNIWGYK